MIYFPYGTYGFALIFQYAQQRRAAGWLAAQNVQPEGMIVNMGRMMNR